MNFKFQSKVYDGCHELMQNYISFNDAVIPSIKGNYYRIHFLYMSINKAINLLANADLIEKSGTS